MAELDPLPYYKWHWLRYRASRTVQRMGVLERGIYRELLDEQWVQGCVRSDDESLKDVLEDSVKVISIAKQVLSKCFAEIEPGIWQNSTLEEQRTERDTIRAKRKIAGRLGGLSKLSSEASAEQTKANAKQVLSKCHIEEKRREEKRSTLSSQDSTEKSEKREKKEKPTDPRRKDFIDDLKGHWDAMNHGSPEFALDGRDCKQVDAFLSKWKALTREEWRVCLKNRRHSLNVIPTMEVYRWVGKLMDFKPGSQNEYNRIDSKPAESAPLEQSETPSQYQARLEREAMASQ